MADSEFDRATAYSNAALGHLRRGHIPPYPQFYELFYTYATGVNPTLNARINELIGDNPGLASAAEKLYEEFLRSKSIDERVTAVSAKISENIESVQDAIINANSSAEKYSGSLARAETIFQDELDPKKLKALAHSLLLKTQSMQEANKSLESKLEASKDDIEMLQRDLDAVQRESMTDALTKVPNRKCFDLEIERAIKDAAERQKPLCLVITDIDHFKKFNDTYGHQTGDQVLRLVAMTLKAHTKGQDLAARYGGEEFAIILPDTDVQGACHLTEKIRKAIQGKELLRRSTNEKLGRVTCSFGIAQFRDDDTSTSLIERADRAMYIAKANGRNKVVSEFDDIAKGELSAA